MGKFVIKTTKTGFTYSLKAGNGEIIATGGEVYNSLASIKNGIESVKKNAPIANIEDQTVEGFATELTRNSRSIRIKPANSDSVLKQETARSSLAAKAM